MPLSGAKEASEFELESAAILFSSAFDRTISISGSCERRWLQWKTKAHGDLTTDTVLSVLISLGIAAFGLWVVVTAGSLLWMILAFLPVIVGLISLYDALRELKAGVTSSWPAKSASSPRPSPARLSKKHR